MRAESFLEAHWQKSTLFVPDAIGTLPAILPPEELAWLATQDDVESRLVFTERSNDKTLYRVETGPFDENKLANLPERDWTLLVQDVDKHLPDFARLFALADFIPAWRIDDLMVSFAAPGGSVGPHKDNYDVFLCQGSGRREWRIGDPDKASDSDESEELSLLRPFSDPSPVTAANGDILYLPPGIPHWGIARDACTTYSIGMRAPTLAELRLCYEREFPDATNPFPDLPGENHIFYTDPDLSQSESTPGRLSAMSIDRCRTLTGATDRAENKELAITLGCVVTDLKAWLSPDIPSVDEANAFLSAHDINAPLQVHGMARLAWWSEGDEMIVFANGRYRISGLHNLALVRVLCATRQLDARLLMTPNRSQLLSWLLDMGAIDVFLSRNM
jgi:50S ribosomal protein L16 3-hydroxylase